MNDTIRNSKLAQSSVDGSTALGALVSAIRGAGPEKSAEVVAADVWPQFRAAVVAALNEAATKQDAGVRRWQDVRHRTER